MINQVAAEARNSATYVGNYLDCVENLPDDAQRQLSRIRDIDVQYRSILRDIDLHYEQYRAICANLTDNPVKRMKIIARIQQCLILAQELGDGKMQIVNQLVEIIDNNSRQLDHDYKSLDYGRDQQLHHEIASKTQRQSSPPIPLPAAVNVKIESQSFNTPPQNLQIGVTQSNSSTSTDRSSIDISKSNTNISETRTNKRSRRPRNENNSALEVANNESNSANEANSSQKPTTSQSSTGTTQKKTTAQASGKKKKRKARGQGNNHANAREDTPPIDPIDPDEPTYCLCDQISFGEMILCDNDLCPIEWFHFSCVALMTKPKGKWYCPNCRGDRPNIMKPKAQFLKELERYNKEREEKN